MDSSDANDGLTLSDRYGIDDDGEIETKRVNLTWREDFYNDFEEWIDANFAQTRRKSQLTQDATLLMMACFDMGFPPHKAIAALQHQRELDELKDEIREIIADEMQPLGPELQSINGELTQTNEYLDRLSRAQQQQNEVLRWAFSGGGGGI